MYAGDLVLISPSAKGLQKLIDCCVSFGMSHDIKYNEIKSAVMTFHCNLLKNNDNPGLNLSYIPLNIVTRVKYLGHILDNNLSDDADIARQTRSLYIQANTILRKFSMCSSSVKIQLFKSLCTPFYMSHRWWNYKKCTISKFYIAYHNCLKIILKIPKCAGNSYIYVSFGVKTCKEVIRTFIYSFLCRLNCSNNSIITDILHLDVFYKSKIKAHWINNLYIHPFM